MKKIVLMLHICLFISCGKKQNGLLMEITSIEIASYGYTDSCYDRGDYPDKAGTVVSYQITNNDDITYYFNKDQDGRNTVKKGDQLFDTATLTTIVISDEKGNIVKPFNIISEPTREYLSYQKILADKLQKNADQLGYKLAGEKKEALDRANFIIHPDETLCFEFYMRLPVGETMSISFDKAKKYFASLELTSDKANYKKVLSRPHLSTIKKNGYSVYNGVLTSTNRVPIRFVDCKK